MAQSSQAPVVSRMASEFTEGSPQRHEAQSEPPCHDSAGPRDEISARAHGREQSGGRPRHQIVERGIDVRRVLTPILKALRVKYRRRAGRWFEVWNADA